MVENFRIFIFLLIRGLRLVSPNGKVKKKKKKKKNEENESNMYGKIMKMTSTLRVMQIYNAFRKIMKKQKDMVKKIILVPYHLYTNKSL